VLRAPGEEFHKTGPSMVDLGTAMEQVGADVIRWLVARGDVQENVYWGSAPTADITRRLLTLWNTYSFFVTYANLDGFDPGAPRVAPSERPLIDRWLLSVLHRLVRDCRAALDRYDAQTACLRLEHFWDDLSTWYVRRNRPRFWGSAKGSDGLAAYQTLYEALTTLGRLFAPVMPHLAEAMYKNLVRRGRKEPASVHHTEYPVADPALIDDVLERRMAAARRVVALGHAARHQAGVKVRMPLPRLIAVFDATDHDRDLLEHDDELAEIIRDELNVKAFEVREHAHGLVREVVRPDLRILGPKLGKALPRVRAALAEGRFRMQDGSVEVEGLTLGSGEVLISHEGTPGHAVGRDAGAVVALETTLTPELEVEGLARELVRRVNELRKEAGLEIADRIVLRYAGGIAPAVERFRDLIAGETLASVEAGRRGTGHRWSGELNGLDAELEIEKR
jgi:isoleucyl-tRNA synthetase